MSEILDRIYPDNESQLFFTEIEDHRKYITELEQQLQQAHRTGFEEGRKQTAQEIAVMFEGQYTDSCPQTNISRAIIKIFGLEE